MASLTPPRHQRRPMHLCRSWVFLEGANEDALDRAAASGADVLIQELEDFTSPPLRPRAHALAASVYPRWRAAGRVVAVRVNPLDAGGADDLAAVMPQKPDIVALPKVAEAAHIKALCDLVGNLERQIGIAQGVTRLLPNIEYARGLVNLPSIIAASPRVDACLLASEDLAADLGAERAPDGAELMYARQRFLLECVAAGVLAIDCPYTFSDAEGVAREAAWARRMGYRAKSAVAIEHIPIVNDAMTPQDAEVARARRLITAFEAARAAGQPRVTLDGALVEWPSYGTAKRLLARHAEFSAFDQQSSN